MRFERFPLVGGAAVLTAALVGVALWWDHASGTGTVYVLGPRDEPMTVLLGGEHRTALASGEHHRFELAQGTHELTLVRPSGATRAHALTIDDGSFTRVAPARGQCLVDLDVTEVRYGGAARPILAGRHFDGEPFDLGPDRHFTERTMPDVLPAGGRTFLIAEVPCELAAASEEALFEAAGWGAARLVP